MSIAKIKIDAVEYELAEGVAKVVSDKITELETLKKEREQLQGRCDSLKAELEKRDKDIETLKSKQLSQKEIVSLAKGRMDLENYAQQVLGETSKLHELSDLELKKAVVQKLSPELKLDNKSEDYIDGFFSSLREGTKDAKGEAFKRALGAARGDAGEVTDATKARADAMERSKNAWKVEEKSSKVA